jgi:hypothetical protein
MAGFHEYLTQAHQLLDTARMLNADSARNDIEFVNTEF